MAERAGAVSVMALERIPADIKKDGGIARASDPSMIREIMEATSIPVMAKARIGHFAEAQVCRFVRGLEVPPNLDRFTRTRLREGARENGP